MCAAGNIFKYPFKDGKCIECEVEIRPTQDFCDDHGGKRCVVCLKTGVRVFDWKICDSCKEQWNIKERCWILFIRDLVDMKLFTLFYGTDGTPVDMKYLIERLNAIWEAQSVGWNQIDELTRKVQLEIRDRDECDRVCDEISALRQRLLSELPRAEDIIRKFRAD